MRYSTLLFAILTGGQTTLAVVARGNYTGCWGGKCAGVCGDGIVQPQWEACDLGPELNGAYHSGCTKDCQKSSWCGDGHVDSGENCDLGFQNGVYNSGCSSDCKCVSICGNGIVEGDEQCDLGSQNGAYNAGCSSNCTIVPICGNGIKEPGEECDAGNANGGYNSGCSTDCKLCGYCGDGIVDDAAGEECDLGFLYNGASGSTCSANCTLQTCTYECGNGIAEPGEECDDGVNNGPNNRCGIDCKWTDCHCGNGVTEFPEQCDDGVLNGTPGSYCTTSCTFVEPCGNPYPPICGNGIVEYPERCDDGYKNGSPESNCTTDCTWSQPAPPRCGDGHIDPGEECDDGKDNGTSQSSCDSTCHKLKPATGSCQTCNPNPFFNMCTITTSCIITPSGSDYCACRAGYRADGLAPTDPLQFRLAFPGQEFRVFVAPGVDCNTLCTTPFPGPDSCKEVPVQGSC